MYVVLWGGGWVEGGSRGENMSKKNPKTYNHGRVLKKQTYGINNRLLEITFSFLVAILVSQ